MKFDPTPYIAYYKEKNEREKRAIQERAVEARREAQRLAREIKRADPEVHSVILFGSLAEDGPRRLDFDIDLAIQGGDDLKAMGIAWDSPFEVDVVDFDALPEHMKVRIMAKGIPL